MNTASERKAAERARKRKGGLRPYEVWMTASEYKAVTKLLAAVRGRLAAAAIERN